MASVEKVPMLQEGYEKLSTQLAALKAERPLIVDAIDHLVGLGGRLIVLGSTGSIGGYSTSGVGTSTRSGSASSSGVNGSGSGAGCGVAQAASHTTASAHHARD